MTFYKTNTHLKLEISYAEARSISKEERCLFSELVMQEIIAFGFDIKRDIVTYIDDNNMHYIFAQTICEIIDPPNLLLLAAPES